MYAGYQIFTGEIHMLIRRENESDYEKVYDVVKASFESAEYADGNEQELVNALRNGDSYIPELSLVAEEEGNIVGYIQSNFRGPDNSFSLQMAYIELAGFSVGRRFTTFCRTTLEWHSLPQLNKLFLGFESFQFFGHKVTKTKFLFHFN